MSRKVLDLGTEDGRVVDTVCVRDTVERDLGVGGVVEVRYRLVQPALGIREWQPTGIEPAPAPTMTP